MNYRLMIARADFAEILDIATMGVKSSDPGYCIRLEFDDGELTAGGPGAAGAAPAAGDWPRAVLMNAAQAKQLSSRLPAPDPTVIDVAGERVAIGGFSMGVQVLESPPPKVELTLGAGPREVLVAVERHGEPSVAASIGGDAVKHARDAAGRAIFSALNSLRRFGVNRAEVEEALFSAIRRQARPDA